MPISKVDTRAERKLAHVADTFAAALGTSGSVETLDELERAVGVKAVPEFDRLILSYSKKQRLFASLFDLVICVDVGAGAAGGPQAADERLADGLTDTTAESSDNKPAQAPEACIRLVNGVFEANVPAYEQVASSMNCALAQDRIKTLGVLDMIATPCGPDAWRLELHQMVGSSTWNLIPPVMQLIDPSVQDCVRTVELLRMMAAALLSRQTSSS